MLSSLVSSNANSPRFAAPAEAVEQAANAGDLSLDANAAQSASAITQELTDDVFAEQLSDALVGVSQADADISAPEIIGEQAAASAPTQPEPSAEEWLLAMLDQQQLQLRARDTAIAVTPVTAGVMTAASLPGDVESVNAQQKISATLLENTAGKNASAPQVTEQLLNKSQENIATAATAVMDKAVDVTAKTAGNIVTANAAVTYTPHADLRSADGDSDAVSTGITAVTHASLLGADGNTAASANIPATTHASLAIVSPATAVLGDSSINNSQLIAPTIVNSASDTSVQRSPQSQLTLHAPEAKWGEQLLHALRDNVQVQIQQKIQNATIRLDPPELGSLEIYLSHESGRLTVNISASQADVARLIQTTSDRLRQELAGPQFTHVNVQTSADGQSGQQQSRERQRSLEDEHILANEQRLASDQQQANRPGDVLVTV